MILLKKLSWLLKFIMAVIVIIFFNLTGYIFFGYGAFVFYFLSGLLGVILWSNHSYVTWRELCVLLGIFGTAIGYLLISVFIFKVNPSFLVLTINMFCFWFFDLIGMALGLSLTAIKPRYKQLNKSA